MFKYSLPKGVDEILRVCIVVDSFFGVGGTETNTRHLVGELQRTGQRVHVVTMGRRKYRIPVKAYGLKFGADESIYAGKRVSFLGALVLRLVQLSSMLVLTLVSSLREKTEIIHAHMALPAGLPAIIAGKILRKPVVVSVRGGDLNVYAYKPIYCELIKFTLNKADAIIALSEGLRKIALRLGVSSEKIHVVPNGIDTEFFGKETREYCRSRLGIVEDKKIILFVGTIESYRRKVKGIEDLLLAMKTVVSKVPTAHLIAVGIPPIPDLLSFVAEAGIEDQVSFVGVVPYDKVSFYYGACDVFVLPSRMEGLPTAVLEAMASSRAVVASDIEGCKDLIEDGVNGSLFPPGRTEDLAEKIVQVLNHKRLAAEFGSRSRKLVETRFTWESVCKRTLALYDRLLTRPRNQENV